MRFRILEGKRGIREAYDAMAVDYDHSPFLYLTRRMEEGEKRVIEKWFRYLKGVLLDVGCGTGRYAIELAKDGLRVIALDISSKMLQKLVEKGRLYGVLERLDVILADGETLPFRAESFDGLICTLTFDHFMCYESVAQEFSRTLKADALCIISTLNSEVLNEFKRRYNIPSDKVPFRTENLPLTLIHEVGHSADEVRKLFARAEFEIIAIRGCCYWHILPTIFTLPINFLQHYCAFLDSAYRVFGSLIRFAVLHVVLFRKHRFPI